MSRSRPILPVRPRSLRLFSVLLLVAVASACATPPPPPAPTPPAPATAVPPRVGLALGGGGARGFAEIGVLRVLEQEKIPIDIVVGTSVGSVVGAFYADSGRVLDAEILALAVQREDLFDFGATALFSGGLARGERLERFIESKLTNRTFETMAVDFAAVACDLRTGETVVFERGRIAPAIRASSAIPGVFAPVVIDGVTYVDGGVTNPIPADVARARGADVVIAVGIPRERPAVSPRNPLDVVRHAIGIMSTEIGRLRAREADVLIQPDVGNVAYDDFGQKKRLIEAGERATRDALPQIRAAIAARTK